MINMYNNCIVLYYVNKLFFKFRILIYSIYDKEILNNYSNIYFKFR